MRRVILQEFVTLDGLAAGPNSSVAFVPASAQGDQKFGQQQFTLLDAVGTILLGRVTYNMFAGYWPNVTRRGEKPFADKLNATRKVVFSKTLSSAPWGKWDEARIVRISSCDEVTKLKQQRGKDLLIWGSISLAQSLMVERLIDEYRLVLCPVVLGRQSGARRHEATRRKTNGSRSSVTVVLPEVTVTVRLQRLQIS